MERYVRILLLGIFVMFGLINNAVAASRMYIVPINSTDFDYIDDYPNASVVYNTPCNGDNYSGYYPHEGMDYVLSVGTSVFAAAAGTVHRDDPGNDYMELCSTEEQNCYGYYMAIDHGSSNWTMYAHLDSYVVNDGDYVEQGDLIAYSGDSGPTYPHLHWEVLTNVSSTPIYGNPHNPYYCDDEWFLDSPPIYADAYRAIDAKADELYWINRNESTSPITPGLIAYETANLHWWGDSDEPYLIVEDWDGGSWGWMVITYDPEVNTDRAYVLRSGFWDAYQLGDPGVFGSPLGDEMDLETDDYDAYDPDCSTKADCVERYCGSIDEFSSMQRFSGQATFCWHQDSWQACLSDPGDAGGEYLPYCYELTEEPSGGAAEILPTAGEFIRGDESEAIYYYDGSTKRWISQVVWNYCNYHDYTEYDQEVIDSLPEGSYWTGSECQPEESKLFKGENDDAVFILDNGSKHWISSDLFSSCSYHWSDVNEHSQNLVDEIPQGNHWGLAECLKQDQLFKGDGGSGAIFRFDDGLKRWVSEPQYYACNYQSLTVSTYPQSLVDEIPQGNHIVCSYPSEGELFRASGSTTVYRMNNGSKRWVVNAETFEACGYGWSNVREYIARVVNSIPTGSNWTLASCKPNGSLARNTSNNGIYYLANGSKRWIPSAAVYEGCGFSWSAYVNYSGETMNYIPSGTTYSCW